MKETKELNELLEKYKSFEKQDNISLIVGLSVLGMISGLFVLDVQGYKKFLFFLILMVVAIINLFYVIFGSEEKKSIQKSFYDIFKKNQKMKEAVWTLVGTKSGSDLEEMNNFFEEKDYFNFMKSFVDFSEKYPEVLMIEDLSEKEIGAVKKLLDANSFEIKKDNSNKLKEKIAKMI